MAAKKEKIRWNIGMIIFLVIFLYTIMNVGMFLAKKKLTVYKVSEDKITNTFSMTGIAIRDEALVKATKNGYITYYVEEGKRVKKTGNVFIIDKDGKVQEIFANRLEAMKNRGKVTDDSEIQRKIKEYQFVYNDNDFSDVYDLKYDLKNVILNLNEKSMKEMIDAVGDQAGKNGFTAQKSPASGIVSFYSDDFDGKSPKEVKASDFEQENYRRVKYLPSDKVKKGDVVCRVTKTENWTVVVPLKKEEYDLLKDSSQVSVKFTEDQIRATADFSAEKKGSDYFGYLTFDDYCVRYVNERYLELDITMDSYDGLKIPNSAIAKKKFYQVPVSFISKGNNGEEEGFSVRTTTDDGEVKVEQKDFKIYKKTKKYCYLDPQEVGENVVLQSMDSDKTFLIEQTQTLSGVYCTNQGYADFRMIETKVKKDDYSIIKEDTKNGVDLYDFIVLDSSTIQENQIIY
jgi:hypothetical protein